jgi:hypothetical protein
MNEKLTINKKYLSLILFIAVIITSLIIIWNHTWKFNFSGSSFVGEGTVEIEFQFENITSGKVNHETMKRDAFRLNEISSDNEWHIDFIEIPVMLNTDSSLQATMYVSIELNRSPGKGTFKSDLWLEPNATIEIWSPDRTVDGERLYDFRLKSGQIMFDTIETNVEGKLIGTFKFQQNGNAINGRFNLVLKEPSALFPTWNND